MNLEHELAIEKKRSLMTTPTIIPAAVDATNVAATQTSFAVDSKKKSAPSSPVKQPDLLLDNDFLEKISKKRKKDVMKISSKLFSLSPFSHSFSRIIKPTLFSQEPSCYNGTRTLD